MTQRISLGPTPSAAAMAGIAMLTEASSEMTREPSAARRTGTGRVYCSPMTTPLSAGITGEMEITVTAERTAHVMGNPGVHVFATHGSSRCWKTSVARCSPRLPRAAAASTMVDVRRLQRVHRWA